MKISNTIKLSRILVVFSAFFLANVYGESVSNNIIDLTNKFERKTSYEKLKNVSRLDGSELKIVYSSGSIKMQNIGDEIVLQVAENKQGYYCSAYFVEHANWFYKKNGLKDIPPISAINQECKKIEF